MPRYGFAPIEAEVDGVTSAAASVIVSKGRLYAGRYLLAPAARPAEPGFQVALFRRGGAAQAALAGAALPFGLVPLLPGVEIVFARACGCWRRRQCRCRPTATPPACLPVEVEDAPGGCGWCCPRP
jgi:hypothetical protein